VENYRSLLLSNAKSGPLRIILFRIILLHFMVRFSGFMFPVFPLKTKNPTVLHIFTSFGLRVRAVFAGFPDLVP